MRDWAAFVRKRLEAEAPPFAADQAAIDELAGHLSEVHAAARAAGADPAQAEAAAEAELAGLGPLAAVLDRRARRAFGRGRAKARPWSGLAADLRQAVRLLRHRPGVAGLAVLMLALGIGLATTVFGVYNAVLLAALPYPDASRLVLLWEADRSSPDDTYIVAAPVYEDWRARQRTLAAMGIWEFVSFNVSAAADPEHVPGIRASASLFDTLGVAPALGRAFTEDEDARGVKVAVISDAVWRTHFGADPEAIGRPIRLNDEPYDVIGVMPPSFTFPRPTTGIYVPMTFTERDRPRDSHSFYVAGRLRDGVAFEQAVADFGRIGDDLAREHAENADETSRPTRLVDFGMAAIERMLAALGGAAVLVLLIACVNVANLLIARAIERRREFALRRAIGAGGGRLARQLFVEGLTLAALGAAGGLVVSWIGVRTLDLLLGRDFLTFWFRGRALVAQDGAVLACAVGVAGATALLFSFAPMAGLRRRALSPAPGDGSPSVSRSALGIRRVLVAMEIGLAIVVLCGAGLLLKSFAALLRVDPGIDSEGVLTMQVSLPQEDTYGPAVRATFCEDIAAAAGPFAAIGAISHLPLTNANAGRGLSIEGRPHDPDNPVNANYRLICPGYFRALGIPFVRGRDARASDREPVVVINRAMADRYWPGENPVGQRLRIGRSEGPPWMHIVGVAENVRHFGLDSDPVREIFVPYRQNAWPLMTIVAKTDGSAGPGAAALREALRRTHPDVPAASVRTMREVVGASVSSRASFLRLLLVYGALGLVLSVVGVYGVLAYFVTQRSRELGIRVALGATGPAIVRLVLRQSIVPVAAGVLAGSAASLWSSRLLVDLLFQTQPHDPGVIAAVGGTVLLAGVAASWIPAHRAAAADPTHVLRND